MFSWKSESQKLRHWWNQIWSQWNRLKPNIEIITFIFNELIAIYLFFKLYIIDYGITVVPIFPLCPPLPSTAHSLRQHPQHCACPWVMYVSSLAAPFPILYFTSAWLFCNYLFLLLNPITSSPIPLHPPPIWQPSKCSLSMILSFLFA